MVLWRVSYKANIDRNDLATLYRRRPKVPGARSRNVVSHGRTAAIDPRIRARIERRGESNPAKFILLRRELAPFGHWRERDRFGCQPFCQRCDQRMLFGTALQLPDAEADEDRHHGQCEKAEASLP